MMSKGRHRPHLSKNHRKKLIQRIIRQNGENTNEKEDVEKESEDECRTSRKTISMDYCFMGTHKRQANKTTVLALRNEQSNWVMGYCTVKKCPVDWVVDTVIP